jgi:hypothetical protein
MNKATLSALTLLATICCGIILDAAENSNVISPLKRQELIDQTKGFLAAKELSALGKNPFQSDATQETAPVSTQSESTIVATTDTVSKGGPAGPRDLLQAIATSASLKPTGFFVLGGQPTLVFGQKRVKAGNFLTITFEGAEYTVEIVSIDRPNFTLRLNREEFTRPIK